VVLGFSAGVRPLKELRRILGVSDDVLRYMIVKRSASYADYKDCDTLRRFVSERGKIRGRKATCPWSPGTSGR
jgi:ribosomal protein S18